MGVLGTFISREWFFVAFIAPDYNRCLWIYKITRFSYCFGKLNFLLVARYFMLVARYFLLVARYFLRVARYFFRANYCEIELLWTAKKCFDNNETPPHIFSLQIFSTYKTIFKVDIKSQILPQLISLWCFYYNIWTPFYLLLCTWRDRSTRSEEFFKKVLLNIPQNSQENICAGVSFTVKLQAEGL